MPNEYFVDYYSSTNVIELKEPSHSSSEELAVEPEGADTNKSAENTEDTSEDYGSTKDVASEAGFDERSLQQINLQNLFTTGDANAKDSRESLYSIDGSRAKFQRVSQLGGVILGIESQPGSATVGFEYLPSSETIVAEFQLGCATSGAESQAGCATSGAESQAGCAICGAESQAGCATSGAKLQAGCATFGDEIQASVGIVGTEHKPGCRSSTISEFSSATSHSGSTSQDSDYSSIHSRETVVVSDFIGQTLPESDAAVVDNSIRQAALENDSSRDVSNSSNIQEELGEGMSAPIQTRPLPFQEEREDEPTEMARFYVQFFRHCGCICNYLTPCSMWLRKYRFFTYFFRTIIAILALLSFGFGGNNVSDCPVNTELPFLLMLLGIDLAILLYTIWKPERFSFAVKVITQAVFAFLFINILRSTYTTSPSFDPANLKKYCKMEFYYFAFYFNIVVAAVFIFAFLLYIPAEIFFYNLHENTQYLQL